MTDYIYNYPEYYDLLYGFDRLSECFFYNHLFQLYNLSGEKEVLELASGTANLSAALSDFNWYLTGIDLSERMIKYALRKHQGRSLRLLQADMISFVEQNRFFAAFCPAGSLGLIHNDEDLFKHLQNISLCLKDKGIYIADILVDEEEELFPYDEVDFARENKDISLSLKDGYIFVKDELKHRNLILEWGRPPRIFSREKLLTLFKNMPFFEFIASYPASESSEGPVFFDPAEFSNKLVKGRQAILLRKK